VNNRRCHTGSFLCLTEAPGDGSPDDFFAEFEADVMEEVLNEEDAYGLGPYNQVHGSDRDEGPTAMDIDSEPYLDRSRTVPAYLIGRQRIEPRVRSDGVDYRHVSPDMVIVRRNQRGTVARVDIVDVAVCLHNRFLSQPTARSGRHMSPYAGPSWPTCGWGTTKSPYGRLRSGCGDTSPNRQ
jgi:hypothetical protein